MNPIHRSVKFLSSDVSALEVRIDPSVYAQTAGVLHMVAAVVGANRVLDLGGGQFSFSNRDEVDPRVAVFTSEQLAGELERLSNMGQPVLAASADQMVVHLWLSFRPTHRHLQAILEKLQPYGAMDIAISDRPMFESGGLVEICIPPFGLRVTPGTFDELNRAIRELFPFGKPWDELTRF